MKKRIGYIDIARGICLILVLYAHARGPYSSLAYQFHMSFFFLISGYFHSFSKSRKEFFRSKLCSLYIPFVFWNTLCIFIKYISGRIRLKAFLTLAGKILLTLEKDGQFFGATWFLGALFTVSVAYRLLNDLIKNRYLLTAVFVLLAAAGFLYVFPYMLSRTLILSFFYAAGALMKQEDIDITRHGNVCLMILSFLIFYLVARHNHANMGANDYSSPPAFIITSFSASYGIFYLSYLLDKTNKKINAFFKLLSRRGIDLVFWQFVVFYLVTIVQTWPKERSLSVIFHTYKAINDTSHYWWIAYFVVGTAGSMFIGYILRKGPWGRFLKKYHLYQ